MPEARAETLVMSLEVVVIPVSDVDRAKRFYVGLGWRLDADFTGPRDFRVVQFTPPGSSCSIQFGRRLTNAAPGSAQNLYLVVSDIVAARGDLDRPRRRRQRDRPPRGARRRSLSGPDPQRQSYASSASLQRSRSQHLARFKKSRSGCPAASTGIRRSLRLVRPCGRASARGGRARRAREADRRPGRELAGLVCRTSSCGNSPDGSFRRDAKAATQGAAGYAADPTKPADACSRRHVDLERRRFFGDRRDPATAADLADFGPARSQSDDARQSATTASASTALDADQTDRRRRCSMSAMPRPAPPTARRSFCCTAGHMTFTASWTSRRCWRRRATG